jgi:transposase-like protein
MSTSPQSSVQGTAEPNDRPRRRSFTAAYKRQIVAEYDAAPDGRKGSILRREGLYSSHLIEWRRAINAGTLAGAALARSEAVRARSAADAAELARLRRANKRLTAELDRTRDALVVMGKVHALLATASESAD